MNPQLFLAFLVVAAALACTPGVDWAYTIAAGLRQRSFVPAVAGLCGGYVLHTVLLVAGLAAVLAGMPGVLGWITLAGAGYLLWLGVGTLRSWRGASFSADAPGAAGIQAAGTQLRTFLPVPVQSGLLGMTFVALAGLVYTAVALLSRSLLQSRPGAARAVTLASGIIMVALGAVLLGEQLVPFLAGRPQ